MRVREEVKAGEAAGVEIRGENRSSTVGAKRRRKQD